MSVTYDTRADGRPGYIYSAPLADPGVAFGVPAQASYPAFAVGLSIGLVTDVSRLARLSASLTSDTSEFEAEAIGEAMGGCMTSVRVALKNLARLYRNDTRTTTLHISPLALQSLGVNPVESKPLDTNGSSFTSPVWRLSNTGEILPMIR
jgi:hypothetical protein